MGGGFTCSRIRLHQFHVWFCRDRESSLHSRIHLRVGDRLEFVANCGVELGHDGVIRVLGQDLFLIEGVEVLLQILFQSWSLNHHSREASSVKNRRGEVVGVDAWGG